MALVDSQDLALRNSEVIEDAYHEHWFFQCQDQSYQFHAPVIYVTKGVVKFMAICILRLESTFDITMVTKLFCAKVGWPKGNYYLQHLDGQQTFRNNCCPTELYVKRKLAIR